MFGKNPILKKHTLPIGGSLLVREVFPTIQGEGPLSGTPATFIRLAGCNLRCHFCDTDFDVEKAHIKSVEELVYACVQYKNKLIVLTGGEPLMQEVGPLIVALRNKGMYVQIETAGSVWPESLTDEVLGTSSTVIVVSPKTPIIHWRVFETASAFKYLVSASSEYNDQGIPITHTQHKGGV